MKRNLSHSDVTGLAGSRPVVGTIPDKSQAPFRGEGIPGQNRVTKQVYDQFSIEHKIVPADGFPNTASNLGRMRVHSYLTKVARKTRIVDVVACGAVFSSFEELPEIRDALGQELRSLQLNEVMFHILVVLYSLDPTPISSTGLAYHVNQLEADITPTLLQLASWNWIARQSDSDTQLTLITLSEKGRDLTSDAIQHYLRAVRSLYSGRRCECQISPHDG